MKAKLLSAAISAAVIGLPTLADAQNSSETVGPPVLRDFQLPGERTVAPPPPPAPIPAPPAAATPRPAPPPTPTPRPKVETPPSRPTALPPASTAPVVEALTEPTTNLIAEPAPLPVEVPPAPAPAPAATAPAGESFPWLYAAGGGLALLALLAWAGSRRRKPRGRRADELLLVTPAEPPPAPIEKMPRPWIEIEFKPAKAAATNEAALVDYDLLVRNSGEAEARNLRADGRMFNAGGQIDSEIRAFFDTPDQANAAIYPLPLPPGETALVRGQVAIPKEQVREVVVEGRRLFIPMVAFNVTYEWGEGERGQTSKSYLVGRETDPPAEKMGAFRLDLGPRIYRSVGFRPSRLALTV